MQLIFKGFLKPSIMHLWHSNRKNTKASIFSKGPKHKQIIQKRNKVANKYIKLSSLMSKDIHKSKTETHIL